MLKDVTGIVTGLTTLSNAAASLAVHMHQAEPMLRAGLGGSEAGANAQEVAALQATLARFYDTQKLVTRRIVAATVQDMKHNAYEPLSGVSDGHPNMLHVAKAVERRNKAQLDFDATRRTSQSQQHIAAAHDHYTAASQDAEDALRAGTAERYATAVGSFSAVLRALTKFYGDANTVMNAMSKDVAALSTVSAAYRNKDKPATAQKATPRATPTTQTASPAFDAPAATQSPKPARAAPVTVFDILDGTAPSPQQGQTPEPQSAKPAAAAAAAAAAATTSRARPSSRPSRRPTAPSPTAPTSTSRSTPPAPASCVSGLPPLLILSPCLFELPSSLHRLFSSHIFFSGLKHNTKHDTQGRRGKKTHAQAHTSRPPTYRKMKKKRNIQEMCGKREMEREEGRKKKTKQQKRLSKGGVTHTRHSAPA